MGKNVKYGSCHTGLRTHTNTHVDVAYLCNRGKGNHASNVIFPDGT